MLRFIKFLVVARPAIVYAIRLLRRARLPALLMPLALMAIIGCEEKDNANERAHVNAMQREVTQASREFITADAKAREGWLEAQKSIELTREAIVKQQSDVQRGLDQLETERRDIAAWRIYDLLTANTLESLGIVVGSLVPLLLLGWLMQRYWHSESSNLLEDLGSPQVSQESEAPINSEFAQLGPSQRPFRRIEPLIEDKAEPNNWLLDA